MAVKTPDPNHQTTWDMQKPDMRNISSILPLINPNPNAIRGTLANEETI